jgi:hypothetical protein
MRTVLIGAAMASTLIGMGQARAQLGYVSPFHNGMGFSYNADGSHDTYVYRNGALFDQHFGNPTPVPPVPAAPPLCADPDYGTGCGY